MLTRFLQLLPRLGEEGAALHARRVSAPRRRSKSLALAAALGLLASSGLVHARPWIEPGDMRARHSLQWLVDQGCLNIPLSTWPVMWADISPALDNPDAAAFCRDSLAWRYLRFERDFHASERLQASLTAGAASREPLFRDFAGGAREEGEIAARLEWVGGGLAVGLAGSYSHDPRDGDRARYDGSYLAGTLGNWVLGAGAIDRWWGPGWHSSTVMSTNARPVPGVWINRKSARPSGWRPASWLGPWNIIAFAGRMEGERVVPNPYLLGARATFRPWRHLEIGLSRTAQWGGEGQSQSWSSIWDAIIGRDNGQQGPAKDPANQLGGMDMRLGFPVGGMALGLYVQSTGEDEAGGLPSKFMNLAGLDLATRAWGGEQRVYLEYTDTTAGSWSGERRPNVAYEHSVYETGYRFNGRNIASTWEGDSLVTTLGAMHFFRNGSDLGLTISQAHLNRDGTMRGRAAGGSVPVLELPDAQKVMIYAASYRRPLLGGRITLAGYYTDKEIDTVLRSWSRGTLMASWEYRFD